MSERTVVTRVVQAAGNMASYLFLLIVAISAFEVLMRYAFAQPTVWVHELSIAFATQRDGTSLSVTLTKGCRLAYRSGRGCCVRCWR